MGPVAGRRRARTDSNTPAIRASSLETLPSNFRFRFLLVAARCFGNIPISVHLLRDYFFEKHLTNGSSVLLTSFLYTFPKALNDQSALFFFIVRICHDPPRAAMAARMRLW